MSGKNIVIFDLDGTLCDIEHRLSFIKGSTNKIDWPAFYAACPNDKPIDDMLEILFALHSTDHEIWIVTGRSDEVREQTLTWLRKFAVVPDKLIMRAAGDHTPDAELKESWITDGTIPIEQVAYVFEDRQRVVDMYRRRGLRVLHVCEGDY